MYNVGSWWMLLLVMIYSVKPASPVFCSRTFQTNSPLENKNPPNQRMDAQTLHLYTSEAQSKSCTLRLYGLCDECSHGVHLQAWSSIFKWETFEMRICMGGIHLSQLQVCLFADWSKPCLVLVRDSVSLMLTTQGHN